MTIPGTPRWLRAGTLARPSAVDRQARVLRGYVVAQEGVFKDRRGVFDAQSLAEIVQHGNASPKGLKSRFAHPTLSSDGVGKFLGRATNFRLDAAAGGVPAVRADLHFNPTASRTPSGDLAGYVMDLAESDPDAFSSSLVIVPKEVQQLDARGRVLLDEGGDPLPAVWRVGSLHASDIVDTGDAVDGLLSAGVDVDALPDSWVRLASEAVDSVFPGATRDVVEARVGAWLAQYLDARFGPQPAPRPRAIDALSVRLAEMQVAVDRMKLNARP